MVFNSVAADHEENSLNCSSFDLSYPLLFIAEFQKDKSEHGNNSSKVTSAMMPSILSPKLFLINPDGKIGKFSN